MGGNFSQPIPILSDAEGYVCIVLRYYNKVRVINAPQVVLETVQRVVTEIHLGEHQLSPKDSHGATQFYLPGRPFMVRTGSDSATIGKMFAIRIFEEMNALGYTIVCSTDLSRMTDQSTWYFHKDHIERPHQPVLCVAPGYLDKIIIVRGRDSVIQTVKESIKAVWSRGIQDERNKMSREEEVYEFKLSGIPWHSEGEDANNCRLLLKDIIVRLGRLKWKLLITTNLKGGSDSLFFIYDENYSSQDDLPLISLNRVDRIRLFNLNSEVENLFRQTIMTNYQTKEPETRQYYDAFEFKLKGTPFAASGAEAIATRKLISRLLEGLLAKGWDTLITIDISRKLSDKSVFFLRKCEPASLKFACISLSSMNKMRFLDFPTDIVQALRNSVAQVYLPGISYERTVDDTIYEMALNGYPWSPNSSYNLQGRSMFIILLRDCTRLGWHFKVSADVSARYVRRKNAPDHPIDTHSWWFCFIPPGTGVRHETAGLTMPMPSAPPMPPTEASNMSMAKSSTETPPPTYDESWKW